VIPERAKYPVVIALICLVAAGGLAVTFALTQDRIAASKQGELDAALKAVLPALDVEQVPLSDGRTAYVGRDGAGDPIGYAAIGSAQGYSSRIEVMVGVDPTMRILGIRVLAQQETPGLGERTREVPPTKSLWRAGADLFTGVEPEPGREPPFQAQFRGKGKGQLALTSKPGAMDGISQLTGATITSRAVVAAVTDAIETIEGQWPKGEHAEPGR